MSTGILSSAHGVFIVAKEAAYNVDAVAAAIAADGALVALGVNSEVEIEPNIDDFRPETLRASRSGVAVSRVPRGSTVTIPMPGRLGVGTTNEPSWGILLEACGFLKAADTADHTYTAKTDNVASVSCWNYERNIESDTGTKWRLSRATGVRLGYQMTMTAAEEPVFVFDGESPSYFPRTVARAYFTDAGLPALLPDGTSAGFTGTLSADASERAICASNTATFNSVPFPFSSITHNHNAPASLVDTQTAAVIGQRAITAVSGNASAGGTISFEMTDMGVAYEAARTALDAGTIANLVVVSTGATRKMTKTLRVQLVGELRKRATTDGAAGWDVDYVCVGDFTTHPFGDNDVVIKFENLA
jgi:hypothetical protein